MLKSISTKFPAFSNELCKTFNNRIPGYIYKEAIEYCNSTKNPSINNFLSTIPSYFIKNHLENYNHGFYYECNKNNDN
jgi:hypothetical protein